MVYLGQGECTVLVNVENVNDLAGKVNVLQQAARLAVDKGCQLIERNLATAVNVKYIKPAGNGMKERWLVWHWRN